MSGETEQQAWIESWARRIDALGLSPVVLALSEVARAFGFLGSQALLMAQPLANGMICDTAVERAAALLESPELLERLEACLEGVKGE